MLACWFAISTRAAVVLAAVAAACACAACVDFAPNCAAAIAAARLSSRDAGLMEGAQRLQALRRRSVGGGQRRGHIIRKLRTLT